MPNLWFSSKVSLVIVDHSLLYQLSARVGSAKSEEITRWHSRAKHIYFTRQPCIDVNSDDFAKMLKAESAATKSWLRTALRSSSGQDRICAMVHLIGSHPMCTLNYLDTLTSFISASKQRDCLQSIAEKSPQLSLPLVDELRSFLFRPNLVERARYYALALLTSIKLTSSNKTSSNINLSQQPKSDNLAVAVLKTYMALFRSLTAGHHNNSGKQQKQPQSDNELPEKLIQTLFTGINRAGPFVPDDKFSEILGDVDDLFRLVHTTGFNVALHALNVLFQLVGQRVSLCDRYYQALYRKLRDPAINDTSHGPNLLHLLFRSMLADSDLDRLAAFYQRLLQLCLGHPQPGFVCGCLLLLGKVAAAKSEFPLLPHSVASSQKPVLDRKASAFVPSADNQTSELTKFDDDDDVEEHFSDAPDSSDLVLDGNAPNNGVDNDTQSAGNEQVSDSIPASSSWLHRAVGSNSAVKRRTQYDANVREPRFAHASGQPLWPLIELARHCHPTISLFASRLLTMAPDSLPVYTGDPFVDFSLQKFLDRFAYKKPKSKGTIASDNADEKSGRPIANPPPGSSLQRRKGKHTGASSVPINSAAYRQFSLNKIPTDERFFHEFFKFITDKNGPSRKKKDNRDSDGSVSDDEFDQYLEKYEKDLVPKDDGLDDEELDDYDDDDGLESNDEKDLDPTMDIDDDDGDDEDAFAEMDGVGGGKKKKSAKQKTSKRELESFQNSEDDWTDMSDGGDDDREVLEDDDFDDDDQEAIDFDDLDGDDDFDDEFTSRKKSKSSSSASLKNLFVSADTFQSSVGDGGKRLRLDNHRQEGRKAKRQRNGGLYDLSKKKSSSKTGQTFNFNRPKNGKKKFDKKNKKNKTGKRQK